MRSAQHSTAQHSTAQMCRVEIHVPKNMPDWQRSQMYRAFDRLKQMGIKDKVFMLFEDLPKGIRVRGGSCPEFVFEAFDEEETEF